MGIGIKELIVILVIVMLMFGTKKVKNIGSDVGGWIRDFKKAIKEGDSETVANNTVASKPVIEGETVVQSDQKHS